MTVRAVAEYNPATWAYDETFAKQMAQSLFNEHGLQIFKFTQAAHYYNEPIREFLKRFGCSHH